MRDLPSRSRSAPSYRISIDRGKRDALIVRLLSPCYKALSYAWNGAWWVLLGWWRDPLAQKRKNQALSDDLQANLHFLCSEGQLLIEEHPVIHPFDYASAKVLLGNVCYCFMRGRGELNVTLSPRHTPTQSHELSQVIAALDSAKLKPISSDFASISSAIHPRLAALDEAFSERQYAEFEKRMP